MALDLWFREDVQRILSSISHTSKTMRAVTDSIEQSPLMTAYADGFDAALSCVAAAFGVTPALETWRVAEGKGER